MEENKKSISYFLTQVHRLKTTELGKERIAKNLQIAIDEALPYCLQKIKEENFIGYIQGKNYYICFDDCVLTIHSSSFTIITAHKA